jgi:hypothetical protein
VSTMAAEHSDRPDVTWRDAVTPLSRASRRRWTACYALLLALLAAGVVDDTFAVHRSGGDIPFILVVAVPVVFGMLRRGTRRIAALDHPDLDERDVAARNAAYRVAFPLLVLVLVATGVLLALALPGATRTTTIHPHEFETTGGSFLGFEAFVAVGLWIVLWAVYLPTAALAWSEPDALEPEDAGGGLPERIRDALLGLALTGGIVVSLVSDDDGGSLLFIAALALIGALGRRAAGQPVMSRQRMLRVGIGIALILVIVAIGLIGVGAGSSESGGGEVQPVKVR